jgi:hypothetical protein
LTSGTVEPRLYHSGSRGPRRLPFYPIPALLLPVVLAGARPPPRTAIQLPLPRLGYGSLRRLTSRQDITTSRRSGTNRRNRYHPTRHRRVSISTRYPLSRACLPPSPAFSGPSPRNPEVDLDHDGRPKCPELSPEEPALAHLHLPPASEHQIHGLSSEQEHRADGLPAHERQPWRETPKRKAHLAVPRPELLGGFAIGGHE